MMTATLASRTIAKQLKGIFASNDANDIFPELALTLYVFTRRLHEVLSADGRRHVYFLSREGQPLQVLYDLYRASRGGLAAASHYLQVSRRATLLPSLGPLCEESFETLFRQYRAISVEEYLGSLGLDAELPMLAQALSVSEETLKQRRPDLPTDPLFVQLCANEKFQSLYERERVRQRRAFLDYFSALNPDAENGGEVVIVDVGWKGTIQDNLQAIFVAAGAASSVRGYYLGLVAPGRALPTNPKHGLLFTALPAPSEGFYTFNENRALFEVVLAADHASVWRYATDGETMPIHGPFEEEAMIRMEVMPLQRLLIERFQALLQLPALAELDDIELGRLAAAHHARMVFYPSSAEQAWFSKVFHVENYGVFERSGFDDRSVRRAGDRLRFCFHLLKRRGRAELGFWPYKTLVERVGYPAARAYSLLRQYQS